MKNRTLVFGASLKTYRYSNMAIQGLISQGEHVFAYGLNEGKISGVKIDTVLIFYDDIDTVTLYLNPKRQSDFMNILFH